MQYGPILTCNRPGCNQTFRRLPKEIRKVNFSYCSRSCAVTVNNARFPKRQKVVKRCARPSCTADVTSSHEYCSRRCFNIERTAYGRNELILLLQKTFQRLGRSPAKRELGPLANNCVRIFSSWNNALFAAGLETHRSHSQRMFKRMNAVASDGHKCDSISEAIIDNWLTKHKILHTRDVRYPTTHHRADWGIGNKIFVEYFGLVKGSPRYDRSIQEKRSLCKKHGINLIEIYPKDLYPIENISLKFPKALTKQRIT